VALREPNEASESSSARREELSVRAVLLTWRQSVRKVRDGYILDSGETVQHLSGRAISLLNRLELQCDPGDVRLLALIRAARGEVRGYVPYKPPKART
jgi:hypothetical protein